MSLFFSSCNKEKLQLPQKEVEKYEREQESELPPIINFERACEQGELIRNGASIEGYSDKESYNPGETVYFSLHSRYPEVSIEVYRYGLQKDLIFSDQINDGEIQNYYCYSYSWGCDWDVNYNYTLPITAKSGYYSVRLKNKSSSWWITFVVKPAAKSADLALIASNNTWTAYNDWGGGSYYTNRISEEARYSENISFARPNKRVDPDTKNHLYGAELYLVEWLEKKQIDFGLFAAHDLHYSPKLLSAYKTIIIQVHPEYYTEEMYDALRSFVRNGGNLMYLGGNGIYAKVLYNPTFRILETRKTGNFHNYVSEKGGLWRDLGKPESAFLGVQYDTRGYDTYHPYKVKDETHWIFNNTGLSTGDEFGNNCERGGASGHETDKITIYSPKNLVHLAKGTNPNEGGADMIFYENANGGKVFSVGSITYTSCLNSDPVISQITENVLTEFLK